MSFDTAGGLERIEAIASRDHHLAVVVTQNDDLSSQVSVVNAGALSHPGRSGRVVGFVARGGSVKLRNLRARPAATLVFRAGWEWVAVSGPTDVERLVKR